VLPSILTPWSLSAVAGGWFFLMAWWIGHPPQVIRWNTNTAWQARWLPMAESMLSRRWNDLTQQAAWVFDFKPRELLTQGAMIAGGILVLFWLILGLPWYLVWPGALLTGWQGPPYFLRTRYLNWRIQVMADFATVALLLRIYWDLGYTVADSLTAIRPALRPAMRYECERMLAAISQGQRGEAWYTFAKRVRHMSVFLLYRIVQYNWDIRLTGEALTPMDTLVDATRTQQLTTLTSRLDATSTIVPMLALGGVMAVFLFALFASLQIHI